MKLSDFAPEIPQFVKAEQKFGALTDMIAKQHGYDSKASTFRLPSIGADTSFVNSWLRQQMQHRKQLINDLMVIAMTVEEIRAPVNHIISEVFRKGVSWKAQFAGKCTNCGQEYAQKEAKCDVCGGTEFAKPDETQKERFNKFLSDCNFWDQSFEDVLRMFHFDINVLDDAYLYLGKEYYRPEGTNEIRSKVIEIRRLDPSAIEIVLDENGLPKNSHFVCYIHRTEETDETPGKCKIDKCGLPKVPAMYKYMHRGVTFYFLDSEIIHEQKFKTDELYGWSPLLTIFEKVMTIKGMDNFLYRYFFERKMPSSMVMVFTDDAESLRTERDKMAAELRLDPHYVPMVAVSSRQGRGKVDLVRLFHTLQEMDYLPVREEIRERIAAMWGVTPVWQGAPDNAGGMSTQTQQLTVMSRVVEGDQRLYHEKVFPEIMEAFGITDWTLELEQPEEKAEATRISFAQQKISAANMLFQMGFDVEIKGSEAGLIDIDFTVSGQAQRPDMLGGFGGQFGSEEQQDAAGGYGDEGGGGEEMQYMQKAAMGLAEQIQKNGYSAPIIKHVNDDMSRIVFEHSDTNYVAKFNAGVLKEIEKQLPARMHAHPGHPPHDKNMPHANNPAPKRDTSMDAEDPEDISLMMQNVKDS